MFESKGRLLLVFGSIFAVMVVIFIILFAVVF
jgi:hypothetical protein